jgi:hypothetical protein
MQGLHVNLRTPSPGLTTLGRGGQALSSLSILRKEFSGCRAQIDMCFCPALPRCLAPPVTARTVPVRFDSCRHDSLNYAAIIRKCPDLVWIWIVGPSDIFLSCSKISV